MPRLTRWYIKAALLYFITALLLSLVMQWPGASDVPWLRVAWPTYLHILVVGWLTQLIFGVALWLFPKHPTAPPGGSDRLGWSSLVLLNAGLLVRIVGEPRALLGFDAAGLLLASAVAQLLAGLAFVVNIWPRVRER